MNPNTLPEAKKNDSLLWKTTIGFGVIAALIGLSLRYFFVSPLSFNFQYILHTHSHLMLLGWLLNALLLLIYRQWNIEIPKVHRWLFWGLCACVAGMLFSFPFQGYAAISITFSTLHLWISYVLLIKIWKLAKHRGLPGKLVKIGIVFFFISTIGPYSMGPMMANEMQSSPWYNQAIFFYLHFQYNGAFLFFLLAYIFEKWPSKPMRISYNGFLFMMTLGAVLTWFHTLDYSFDSIWINMAGGLGALLQLLAGFYFLKSIDRNQIGTSQWLILAMLGAKWLIQILGSFPAIAEVAVQNRFYLIAWLHFIFLGIFTPFIWSVFKSRIENFPTIMTMYWIVFFCTEAVLVLPSLNLIEGFYFWPHLTFGFYAVFVLIWIYMAFQVIKSFKTSNKIA